VWAGAAEDVARKVRLKIKLLHENELLKRRCLNHVWTNKYVWRNIGPKARAATRLTGRVRRVKKCP
jgi:hypothetical protein